MIRLQTHRERFRAFGQSAIDIGLVVLAFWSVHALLRVLLLFRLDPYGIPFVNKPDWYIFHAWSIDFQWVVDWCWPWLLAAFVLPPASRFRRWIVPTLFTVHALILQITLVDNEVQRFLGIHLSFGLADTYKDTSSLSMLWNYFADDHSVPYLQPVLVVVLTPLVYMVWRFLKKSVRNRRNKPGFGRRAFLVLGIFYLLTWLFLNVIWTGAGRMRKLEPVVQIARRELATEIRGTNAGPADISAFSAVYQREWRVAQGDSSWRFPSAETPFWRIPVRDLPDSLRWPMPGGKRPNFVVVFLESYRALEVGYLKPWGAFSASTPFLDSLAATGQAWARFHVGGLPTIGGLLSSHTSLVFHRYENTPTELAGTRVPSFASVLRDSGWVTHFFSAADPAWDNETPWMRKWYDGIHYDRRREDDSTFFDAVADYLRDSLSHDRPFLASLMSRSDHYPFDLAPGMPDSVKALPAVERQRWCMRWTDRQLQRFFHRVQAEPWGANTIFCILADHGFPHGEHGGATIGYGGYSESTWIPFVLWGNHPWLRNPELHMGAAGQIDIAPTLMELAGLRASVPFAGHSLFRSAGHPLTLGVHGGMGTLGKDGYRLIAGYRGSPREGGDVLFADSADILQKYPLGDSARLVSMVRLLDTLLTVTDWAWSRDRMEPADP